MTCEQCAEHPFAGQNTQHTALRGANSAATGSLPAWVSLSKSAYQTYYSSIAYLQGKV